MKQKNKYYCIFSVLFLLFIINIFSINVFAKTETIQLQNTDNVNLIEMAKLLHENYTIENNTYVFSFNEHTLELIPNNCLLKIDNKLKAIDTETKNGIVLPKYKTLNISEDNVEINYDLFFDLFKYSKTENGIEIQLEDDYQIPETKNIQNLDFEYLNENLSKLGYISQNNTFQYIINNDVYQEISISDKSLIIKTNIGEKYNENDNITNLLIEEILKGLDSINYREIYNSYLNKETTEKQTDIFNIKMSFNDKYSQIQIDKK